MANALEAASLVMIPSGYEDGTLGSLKPTDGSGDFTFSRGSNLSATRINEQGYIEKGYENLLLQSNTFSDAAWSQSGTTITSGQSGYDGSSDAWEIGRDGGSGLAFINQVISATALQTFSIYAKANTEDWIFLQVAATGGGAGYFDLANGTSGSTSGIDSSIDSIGDGWYRIQIVFNSTTSGSIRIFVASANGNLTTTGSIYIQDAMLNQGMVAYPYVETTTAPVAGGILEDMPRLDYSNGSCPSLLLEPSRTNLITQSEYPEGNQFFNNLNADYNATTSPEGIQNATRITATGTGTHQYGNYPVVSSGVGVVGSVFVKADATEYVQLYFGGGPASGSPYANFFIGNNPSVEQERDLTASIEDYGNGWLRLIIKQTTDASGGITFAVMPIPNGTTNRSASYTANGESIFTYGLQVEQDATYPTSYIPTYGVSQTRLSDVCGGAGDAETFNDNEGVLYAEISVLANDGTFRNISVSNGTFSQAIRIYYRNNDDEITIFLNSDSGGSTTISIPSATDYIKLVVKYDTDTIKIFINGVLEDTLSSLIMPTGLQQLDFSRAGSLPFYGNTKQLLYFPTALSDSECIALTTI